MTQPAAPTGSLLAGSLAALGGALAGAVLWAVFSTTTDFKIGWIAIGVGAAAGFLGGKAGGAHPRLPFVAAAIGLLGCVVGDLLIDAHALSAALQKVEGVHVSSFRILRDMASDPSGTGWPVYKAGFGALDVLFYGLAASAAFRLATAHAPQPAMVPLPPTLPTTPPTAPPATPPAAQPDQPES